jgi:hypothetical protein
LDRGGALVFLFFLPGRTSALLASTPFNVSLSGKIRLPRHSAGASECPACPTCKSPRTWHKGV